jgi:hypothetical protein
MRELRQGRAGARRVLRPFHNSPGRQESQLLLDVLQGFSADSP